MTWYCASVIIIYSNPNGFTAPLRSAVHVRPRNANLARDFQARTPPRFLQGFRGLAPRPALPSLHLHLRVLAELDLEGEGGGRD